jgi:phage terminase large subunit-like protein
MWLPHQIIADFTGNQRGKTAQKARQYVLRILGRHPIPHRNVLYFECPNQGEHNWFLKDFGDGVKVPIYQYGEYGPFNFPKHGKCWVCGEPVRPHQRNTRVIRFCSETLPGEKETVSIDGSGQSGDVRNTIYPEFKKWLPRFLIKKDITARTPAIRIRDPWTGYKFGKYEHAGEDIIIEYTSYGQRIQAAAGVQRLSIWMDEEPPYDFYEEQIPRLLAEKGDMHLTLTPANRMSWTFDEVFERAELYIRTKAITDFLSKSEKKKKPVNQVEHTDEKQSIAVIQAATDDNPTLDIDAIESLIEYEDPDTVATRRYGVFRQSTGRIFGDFNYKTHSVSLEDSFWDLAVGEF